MVRKVSVIIPAGGPPCRINPRVSKCLLELSPGHTLLDRQVKVLRAVLHDPDIVVVADSSYSDRMPKGVRLVTSCRQEDTHVAEAIRVGAEHAIYPRYLIVYGDLVFNEAAIAAITHFGSGVITGPMDRREVGLSHQFGRVLQFAYGLPEKWGQIAYLGGKEAGLLREVVSEHPRWTGPEVLNEVIDRGGRLRLVRPRRLKLVEVDTVRDLKRVACEF